MVPHQAIIDSGKKFCLMVTGGGQEVVGELTRYGGMSGSLLAASVPYSRDSLAEYLGGSFDRAVSRQVALAGAMCAYKNALRLAPGEKVFGVAATSVLGTGDGERRGREHRTIIAGQNRDRTVVYEITLGRERTRREEERLVSELILQAIVAECSLFHTMHWLLDDADAYHTECGFGFDVDAYGLIHGFVRKYPNEDSRAIFASSCNPLGPHHLAIIEHAANWLGHPIDIELCVTNPDKPPLDYLTISERLEQVDEAISGNPAVGRVFLTATPRFIDKAHAFPNTTFVVGTDTIKRIGDPKYCGTIEQLRNYCNYWMSHGNRFLVYDRANINFDLYDIPHWLRYLCHFIGPDDGFTPINLSSTELRSQHANH
jgi:hypothetical protein